jgi:hypothetical protein
MNYLTSQNKDTSILWDNLNGKGILIVWFVSNCSGFYLDLYNYGFSREMGFGKLLLEGTILLWRQ